MATEETVLQHFGVKGMKWGVRKRRSSGPTGPTRVVLKTPPGKGVSTTGGDRHPAHRDAKIAAVAAQKAKKSGTASLSDKELKLLLNRLDMEQKYRKANPPKGAKVFIANQLKAFGNQEVAKLARGDVTRIEQIAALFDGQGIKGKHRKK
jgi:hypothetical protein